MPCAGLLGHVILDDGSFRNTRYETPLDLAATNGHEDVVQFLLDEDISPNNPKDKDKVPLISAAGLTCVFSRDKVARS